jgi:hypothetical protein
MFAVLRDVKRSSQLAVFTGVAIVVASAASPAQAAFFDPALPGATASDSWPNFDNWSGTGTPSYGGTFPGAGAWGASMVAVNSTQGAGNEAEFMKVSGNGYPITQGGPKFIYLPTLAAPGTSVFKVFDDGAVANVKTVVFQISTAPGQLGDPTITSLPTLTYNGGTAGPAFEAGGGAVSVNPADEFTEWFFQWNLSGVATPITDFSIQWSMLANHGQIYGLQVNQGDTFVPVPEPTSAGVLLGAIALNGLRRRRRRPC